MPRQLLHDEIARARLHLQQQPLPAPHHNDVEHTLAELELHLRAPEPPEPKQFLQTLQSMEVMLASEHPVLAGVLANVTRLLADLGI